MRRITQLASYLVIGFTLLACTPASNCSRIELATKYLEENAFEKMDFFKNSTVNYDVGPLYEDKIQILGVSICETLNTTGTETLTKISRNWIGGEDVEFITPHSCPQKVENLVLGKGGQSIETLAGTYVHSNEQLVLLRFAKSDSCGRHSAILFYLVLVGDVVAEWCYNPLVDNNFGSACK